MMTCQASAIRFTSRNLILSFWNGNAFHQMRLRNVLSLWGTYDLRINRQICRTSVDISIYNLIINRFQNSEKNCKKCFWFCRYTWSPNVFEERIPSSQIFCFKYKNQDLRKFVSKSWIFFFFFLKIVGGISPYKISALLFLFNRNYLLLLENDMEDIACTTPKEFFWESISPPQEEPRSCKPNQQ